MKPIISLFFLFFLLWETGTAQTTTLDSLAAEVEQLPDDTAKVRQLYDLAKKYDKDNWENGLTFFHKTYALAKRLNAREWLPKLEYAIARDHANIGRLDSALVYTRCSSFLKKTDFSKS